MIRLQEAHHGQGIMSSWLWGLLVFGAIRLCPVSGGDKPKTEMSGYLRLGAVRGEQGEMDVETDV